jgi:D-alanine-D-alanine ligase
MMNLTVVVLVDEHVLVLGSRRFAADEPDRHVVEALRTFVKRVVVHPYTSVPEFAKMIEETAPSLIFNLTEHGDGDRRKDSHICALMDLYGIPYTGTGPAGMMLCRDKALSKLIAAREGFRVPEFFTTSASAPRLPRDVTFPVVVKPRFGDGSDGIHQNSLVGTSKTLLQRVAATRRSGEDAVICEEYVRGRDILVTIAGRRLMPAREYVVGSAAPDAPRLASYRLKHDKKYRRRWKIRMAFAQLTPEQQRRLELAALRTFDALEMRDYGRLDLRLTPSGEWVFLEANPNPPIVPFEKSFSGSWAGVDHREIVREIVQRALRRKH